jgi:hypothetical protein
MGRQARAAQLTVGLHMCTPYPIGRRLTKRNLHT